MNQHCDRCGRPVIRRADGKILDPHPHPEGPYLPDGGTVNPLDAAAAYYKRGPAVGHRVHRCPAVEGVLADGGGPGRRVAP